MTRSLPWRIAGLAAHEGREAWAGEVCGDCGPIGFHDETSFRPDDCCH